MFSSFFVNRPIFASVVSIVLVVFGALALLSLPIARYPEIAPPTIVVSASYPGANATVVAETVATPIEEQVNGVEGMVSMASTCSSDGSMALNVVFEVGTDLDMASVQVQNRVAAAEPRLPEEVRRQGIRVEKRAAEITLAVAVTSTDPEHDALFLSNFVTLRLLDEVRRVPGVGSASTFGAGEYGMRIWIDPTQLEALDLTTTDVINAIREQNVQVAAGTIGGPPADDAQSFQYTVNVRGRLADPDAFGEIILRSGDRGALVRVRDVARVELGARSYAVTSRFNASPSATILIYQRPGANAIDVADGVRATLDELAATYPDGVRHDVVYDATVVIRASIREVVMTLLIAVVLVVLTVFVFLQNVRATLIPAITIPVALVGTFAVMAALGFTINQLTLFGLVLAIGIVVDDAIVVVENVSRHLAEGVRDPRDASRQAMREVSGPIVATTLVLLAVFVPTLFMDGIVGQLFQQFSVTISVATVLSSINALTLSPALCGVLLRPPKAKKVLPFRLFDRALDRGTALYLGTTRRVVRFAVLGVIGFIVIAVVAGWGLVRLPGGFVPQEDEGWCIVSVQLPDASTLARTSAVTRDLERIARQVPGVRDVIAIDGFSMLDGAMGSNSAALIMTLDDWDERTTRMLSQRAIAMRLNLAFMQYPDAIAFAITPPSLPGVGVASGFSMQVQDREGVGSSVLESAAAEFAHRANAQSALTRVFTSFRSNVPQLHIEIDREQVESLDVRLADVHATISAALGGAYVNDFTRFGRIFQVQLQAESSARATPEDIRRLVVRNRQGEMVPLGALLTVRRTFGPQTVTRYNGYPSARVTGQAMPGLSSGAALTLVAEMADAELPPGVGYEWADLSLQESRSSGGAGVIFALAIGLVFLVLAAQYESWFLPIAVCLTVPASLLGAVIATLVRQADLNAYTQIGIVLLIGLAAKTAILIVEFARERRAAGASIEDAALDAARLRFRAVLMTALSFILGVLPLLVATGAGAASRQAIGWVVFGGMLVGTALGVVLAPLFFRLVQSAAERVVPTRAS